MEVVQIWWRVFLVSGRRATRIGVQRQRGRRVVDGEVSLPAKRLLSVGMDGKWWQNPYRRSLVSDKPSFI
jgi:hypothetical protein